MYEPAPLWSELRAVKEPLRLIRDGSALRAAPRGTGTVLVLPGIYTSDRSTLPLRRWIAYLGYDTHGWGLGQNHGHLATLLPILDERVVELGPVSLVGWSWGGVIARQLARRNPEQVRQVISLGSPISGGAENTAFGRRMDPELLAKTAEAAAEREREPLGVPALSIYTRTDAVVAWQASVDPDPDTEHLEVDSSHFGLGINPSVWLAIARRLAEEGQGKVG